MNRREMTYPADEPKALTRNFLIATPRLEFPATHSKQSPLTFSNREWIAVFHKKSSATTAQTHNLRRRHKSRPTASDKMCLAGLRNQARDRIHQIELRQDFQFAVG